MKILCVNDNRLRSADGTIGHGIGLKKGEIYKYTHVINNSHGDDCYFVNGLGLRQCKRFKPIEDKWVDELLNRITEDYFLTV